ncbi:MAG: phage head morphogenesis protein, partial [Lachnospiraceae bacterium]|nr:phage head morphogenesis protein [Lachnospiraceae bacterium]
MPDGRYWKRRMEAVEKMSHDRGADFAEFVRKQFEASIRSMEKETEMWYGRIADNNDITLAQAKKLLSKNELEDFHMTVKEYIKKGETLQYSDEWAKQLENASAKVHISRLEALKFQLRQECEALYGSLEDGLGKTMKRVYEDGYYHTAYEIMKGQGVGYTFHRLDTRRIEKAVDTVWAGDGRNFRARCWTDKQKLSNELQTVLTQSI